MDGSRNLRHSFASLLIWEGRSITYVAAQLGHSPAMTLRTYAHVFEEFEDVERMTAEEAIQRARGKSVPPNTFWSSAPETLD